MAGYAKFLEKMPAPGSRGARMREATPQPRVDASRLASASSTGTVSPSAGPVQTLQRLAGNQAAMRMLDVQRAAADLREPSGEAIRTAATEGVRTPSTSLPYLDRIQASFGRHSIGSIQAHVGSAAARASQAMNAQAYATGSHVVFGARPDLRTAAHEAAHIVQQRAGVQLAGGIGRVGDTYERHADAVADAVVAGRSAEGMLEPFGPRTIASENIQRITAYDFLAYTLERKSNPLDREWVKTAASLRMLMKLIKRGGKQSTTIKRNTNAKFDQSTNNRQLPDDMWEIGVKKVLQTAHPSDPRSRRDGSDDWEHQSNVRVTDDPFATAAAFDDKRPFSDLKGDRLMDRVDFWIHTLNKWSQNGNDEFAAAASALHDAWKSSGKGFEPLLEERFVDGGFFGKVPYETPWRTGEADSPFRSHYPQADPNPALFTSATYNLFPQTHSGEEPNPVYWGTTFHSAIDDRSHQVYRSNALYDSEPGDLTICFHSALDNRDHFVFVVDDRNEVFVESNPTPLKTIIDNKKWQTVKISKNIVDKLKKLQTDAIRLLKDFGTKRTKGAGDRLRLVLKAAATALSSVVRLPETNLSKSEYYGSNSGTTEGTRVVAKPLSLNSKQAGHGPVKDGRLMTALRNAAGSQSSAYKQMHLLNDNVFGPGELWNLTPGPAKSNREMETKVETYLKRAVLDKGLVLSFKAEVVYKKDPVVAPANMIAQNPDEYRFTEINFKATQLDPATMQAVTRQDSDVTAINRKLTWNRGNLAPLKLKPRILSSTTTAKDLVNVGFPKAHAERIVAYTKANSPVTLPGKQDKKQQLASLVKAWDKGRTMGTGKWRANQVFWT